MIMLLRQCADRNDSQDSGGTGVQCRPHRHDRRSFRCNRDDLEHAGMHVIKQMAVERPIAFLIRGQIEGCTATRLHDHDVLVWLEASRRAVDQFEEQAVQDGSGAPSWCCSPA